MSVLLLSMDVTIVNVALPAIQRDLHATVAQLQWVIDAYTLVLASLLMFSGAMSDRFGRRRIFLIGMVGFIAGSLLCGTAPTIAWLIFFRALQGLGASMMNPVALSIIANVFPEPGDRARAVGIWGAVAGASLAIGPMLGGFLTQTVGWRTIFHINVPLGIAAVVLTAIYVPESKAARARRPDPPGQVLIFLTLGMVMYAIIDGPQRGWGSPVILALFALSAVLFVLFLVVESRRTEPLLNLRFFRSVPFSIATVLALTSFGCFAGFLFLNALYLEQLRGFSPLRTGFSTLPLALAMTFTAPLSGRLVAKRGAAPSLVIAGVGFVVATLLLGELSATTPVALLMVAYTLFGVGLGMSNPAISNSAVSGMPLSQAGVAAAIASTGRQVGAALGVAIAGTVVSVSRARHTDLAQATHPIFALMTAGGALVLAAAWISTTSWAKESPKRVAFLFQG